MFEKTKQTKGIPTHTSVGIDKESFFIIFARHNLSYIFRYIRHLCVCVHVYFISFLHE